MAKIVLNESAPADLNGVSLGNAELSDFPYETSDPEVLANAESHPFLSVEAEPQPEVSFTVASAIDPEDDPLSARNVRALSVNDPDAVREVEEAKAQEFAPVAVDAGRDQGEEGFVGKVAVTLAAADVQEPVVEAPAPSDTYNDFGENS